MFAQSTIRQRLCSNTSSQEGCLGTVYGEKSTFKVGVPWLWLSAVLPAVTCVYVLSLEISQECVDM